MAMLVTIQHFHSIALKDNKAVEAFIVRSTSRSEYALR
jgi:hypothetical protein